MPVLLPIDYLAELWPDKLRGARIGALLHAASISSKLEHSSRILERHNGELFRLAAFFGPQHGFLGQTQDNVIEWQSYRHPRGSTRPFEIFGAPFIDAEKLCRELNDLRLPAVFFRENYFQPTFHKFAGELCRGAQLHVVDRNSFRPFQTAVEIIKRIRAIYGEEFQWKQPPYEYEREKLPIEILLGRGVSEFFGS
jgi:uncharacterized protein YbbC (DUF1343 family)